MAIGPPPWVIVEQNEGLIVETFKDSRVNLLFIDYDESKQNKDYAMEKLKEVLDHAAWDDIPRRHLDRIYDSLLSQWPTLYTEYEAQCR